MAHVSRSSVINASAAEVWKIVGPFDGIANWHPAITECRMESRNGRTYRHLTMADGGSLAERHMGTDGTSMGYAIEESASQSRATWAPSPYTIRTTAAY